MGEIKKKKFKEPLTYYWMFFLGAVWAILTLWVSISLGFFRTEEEVVKMFAERDLIGPAGQRTGILLQQALAHRFGKAGIMALVIGGALGSIFFLWRQVAEYLRYKKKCRLYHEGLIKKFYDIYDDHVPLLSWRRIKTLLQKKEKTDKRKLPSTRKMKREIKRAKKQYKI